MNSAWCKWALLVIGLTFSVRGVEAQILIPWSSPTSLTGDSDISTLGTYFDAVNTSQSGYTTTAANGVTFNALSFSGGTATDGYLTVSLDGGTYAGDGFAGGSADYQTIVDTGSDANVGSVTIGSALHPLAIGTTYQVQVWSVWTHGPYQATVVGSPDAVFPYAAAAYSLGSFTATATTETFGWTGGNGPGAYGFLNDISVRAVPEPSTSALLAGAALLLGAATWMRRRTVAA